MSEESRLRAVFHTQQLGDQALRRLEMCLLGFFLQSHIWCGGFNSETRQRKRLQSLVQTAPPPASCCDIPARSHTDDRHRAEQRCCQLLREALPCHRSGVSVGEVGLPRSSAGQAAVSQWVHLSTLPTFPVLVTGQVATLCMGVGAKILSSPRLQEGFLASWSVPDLVVLLPGTALENQARACWVCFRMPPPQEACQDLMVPPLCAHPITASHCVRVSLSRHLSSSPTVGDTSRFDG